MSSNKWSAPFHGVQHLSGMKRGFQVTVTDYDSFAECSVFVPGCEFNATDSNHDTLAQAQAHGEQQASLLGAAS